MALTRAGATGGGDARRTLTDLLRRVDKLERTSTLRGASISGGKPLTVRGGGSIVVEDGGNVIVTDGNGNVLFDALRSTEVTVARGLSGSHPMTADGSFHESPQASIHIGIPPGFDHVNLIIGGHAGHTVNGTGNSWIAATAAALFLDADDNPVPPVAVSGDVADAYCPFHPDGGPAAPATVGSAQATIPPTATRIKVSTYYALALAGQTQGAGDGNTSLNVTAIFGHA